jgi:phosphate ABC transporter phosphate-binding protein
MTRSGITRFRDHRRAVTAVRLLLAFALIAITAAGPGTGVAHADNYAPISGAGSTWSANALQQWGKDVNQYGMTINYNPTGSSDGRKEFLNGTVDFAASDIPFQFHPEDGSQPEQPAAGSYAYMPITAGGTVFVYNLKIGGKRVTNLRLSGTNVTKIFTGVIKSWNDPALVADNPGLSLPNRQIVPVVRSDGSGSTAQFTLWMISRHNDVWSAYCPKVGRANACGETSYYPTLPGMIAQSGDLGVMGYVSQDYADGSIGYVNYSYALNAGFPVIKLLNPAGFYTEPTAQNVAVSLLQAQINTDATSPDYLTQKLDGVYADTDPRTYELSSYSYLILPTTLQGKFDATKGKTLAAFSYYSMCQGQQEAASLGYSPMPINLVNASFEQIRKIPGAVVQNIALSSCHNPTFSTNGTNTLVATAVQPSACDKQGKTQNPAGTGGDHTATPVLTAAACTTAAVGPTGNSGATTGTSVRGTGTGTGSNAPGVTSAGGNGSAGSTAGGTVATGTGSGPSPTCIDSGTCSASVVGSSGGTPVALPVVLTNATPWGSIVLAILLLIVLVVAPGAVGWALTTRNRSS